MVAGVQGSPVPLLEKAERFTVTLADDGQGWGKWLAVALMDKAANSPE